MNKQEFLEKLKKKISMLEQSEIDDIISEYEGFIDEKVSSGMSEKDAVKSLGNIDEIAKDLKHAYKLKDEDEMSAKEVINTFMDRVMNYVDAVIKVFEKKTFSDVIKMILEVILLLIIIGICKIPIEILLDIAHDAFITLGVSVGNFLFHIFEFFINVIYFILAIIFFFRIFKEKILGDDIIEEVKEEKESKKTSTKETKTTKEKKVTCERHNKGFLDVCSEVILVFIKFIVACISIGNICFIVGVSSALVVAIYLIATGVPYYGPLIILVALLMGGICFLELFIRFILDYKQKVIRFIITLIASLLIGGSGIGIFSIELANTTIINEIPTDKLQKVTEEYDMEDDIVISNNLFVEYVEDETLTDKIKIEYSYYYDYFEFEPSTYISNNENYKVYHMNYSVNWSPKSFSNLVKDLKKKRINNAVDAAKVKVITSSDNIKKLEKNYDDYVNRIDYETGRSYTPVLD